MRSRASSLPLACWRSTARSGPAWRACSLRLASSARRSAMEWVAIGTEAYRRIPPEAARRAPAAGG